MEETNRVYRIRTKIGNEAPNVVHVPLNQTYDTFEILSLSIGQTNTYKTYKSDYGIIIGRVIANGGFGIENAKVSVFIEVGDDIELKDRLLYNFTSVNDHDNQGIRYNLLPDYIDDDCYQNVGTFPNKRFVLDNQDVIEMFDKYWKYTTTTNHAGDYMIFGVPVGSQTVHTDIDLSDCGVLSQRPRDMMAKGYNETMFESPNKFKSSTDLNSLVQIVSQDKGVYVYPYWGDESDGNEEYGITRCDINVDYKFESYAVFMGSIITDKGNNAIGKNCHACDNNGKMEELISGEGKIEMIRKTIDNKVEEFPIMGNRLIDGDGVWCYQIPMNLDYITTDEFGNLIPTDNPDKGIATRTRVRFRITLDSNPDDASARKRASYLVPNNPRMEDTEFNKTHEPDYEFGSLTREESYCDLFWNKVYSVKNYIPKLVKNNSTTTRKHTGIKWINYPGDNNPMPYNALTMKLEFEYRFLCVIFDIFIALVSVLNGIISVLGELPCWLSNIPFIGSLVEKFTPTCIEISSKICQDENTPYVWYPGCITPCIWRLTKKDCDREYNRGKKNEDKKICSKKTANLYNCVETALQQSNQAASFNFYNDWINGTLYAPLWYRKITQKKRFFFGLFTTRKAKDEWCSADRYFKGVRIAQSCAIKRTEQSKDSYENFDGNQITPRYVGKIDVEDENYNNKVNIDKLNGIIKPKETILKETIYYYTPVQYDETLNRNGDIKLLFATDIILLGSLNDCDINGVPQFFKALDSTTYNLPETLLVNDYEYTPVLDEDGNYIEEEYNVTSEMAGQDWGNKNEFKKIDGGLFYDIGCNSINFRPKSCINLIRICEFGVSLDETKEVADLNSITSVNGDNVFTKLVTDGFISWDELYNLDERSMFATMNGNRLKTKLNAKNSLREYDFRYLYTDNFDGSLGNIMEDTTKRYDSKINYKNNYKLEQFSRDYYIFRMGNNPFFYDKDGAFPRYENSFYFYFGLKAGKTAIEKFNSKYFAECNNANNVYSQISIDYKPNSWCSEIDIDSTTTSCFTSNNCDGYVAFDFSKAEGPYELIINNDNDENYTLQVKQITDEKIIITNDTNFNTGGSFTDYKQLKINENDCITYDNTSNTYVPMLKNGNYSATLIDEDREKNNFTFNIQGNYLTFENSVQDFEIDEKMLNGLFLTPIDVIHNEDDKLKHESDKTDWYCEYGGVITIKNIAINDERTPSYKIEIRPKESITWTQEVNNEIEYVEYIGIEINKQDSDITATETIQITRGGSKEIISNTITDKRNYTYNYDSEVTFFGIKVPKGDIDYDIIVTQLCKIQIDETTNWVDTNNSVITTVKVHYPIQFKMFINDVDYDLIKNFDKVIIENNPNTSNSKYSLEYSYGWEPKGKISRQRSIRVDKSSTEYNITDCKVVDKKRGIIFKNNPWFNFNNIWSKDEFKNISYIEPLEIIETETFKKNDEYQGMLIKVKFLPIVFNIETRSWFNNTIKLDSDYVVVYYDYTYIEIKTGEHFINSDFVGLYVIVKENGNITNYYWNTDRNEYRTTAIDIYAKCTNGIYYKWDYGATPQRYVEIDNNGNIYYEWKYNYDKDKWMYELTSFNNIIRSIGNKNILTRCIDNEQNEKYLTLRELLLEFTQEDVNKYSLEQITSEGFIPDENFDLSKRVHYTWSGDYIASDYNVLSSFNNVSIYNEDNIQDLLNDINNFISKSNEIIDLRNELPSLMQDSFYLNCLNEEKVIDITVYTSNKPATVMMLHQKESDNEDNSGKALTDERLFTIEEDSISVAIPTITYASSEYGIAGETDTYGNIEKYGYVYKPSEPVLTKYNDEYDRDAFYVATADMKKNTKPAHLKTRQSDDVIKIDDGRNNLSEMFAFPIVDNRTIVDCIIWSYIDNMPLYKKGIEINTYGILRGNILNGNAVNDHFATQTFGNYDLQLTINQEERTNTYIEKRKIQGYTTEGKVQFIKRVINDILSYLNELSDNIHTAAEMEIYNTKRNALITKFFKPSTTTEWKDSSITEIDKKIYYDIHCIDIITSLEYDEAQSLVYEDDTVKITWEVDNLYTDNVSYIKTPSGVPESQVPVYNKKDYLEITDRQGCGADEEIYGDLRIMLNNDSVNDCKNNTAMSLDVYTNANDDNTFYSIFKVDSEHPYPLSNDSITSINELGQVRIVTDGSIFSSDFTSNKLREGGSDILDTNFKSLTYVYDDNGEKLCKCANGYGNSGRFRYGTRCIESDCDFVKNTNSERYSVFVVAETSNHCRAISPVYEFARIVGDFAIGTLHHNNGSSESVCGVKIKDNSGQYYLEAYPYELYGVLTFKKHNDWGDEMIIDVSEREIYGINKYNFITISTETYEKIKFRLNHIKKTSDDKIQDYIDIEVGAYDFVNLHHLCQINLKKPVSDIDPTVHRNFNIDIIWYSVVWNANLPEGAPSSSIGILYNGITQKVEDIYEKNETITEGRTVKDCDEYEFKWWSKTPNGSAETFSNVTVTGCCTFYGVWEVHKYYWVHFLDNEDNTSEILSLIQHIKEGEKAEKPSELNDSFNGVEWYEKGDSTMAVFDFANTQINQETWLVRKKAINNG